VDEAGDVAVGGGGLDERVNGIAGGHVDGRGAHVEPGVAHHRGGGRLRVGLAEIGDTTCLPVLTRRAIAWPIEPGPMTATTSLVVRS
jgi:hypothetical protein